MKSERFETGNLSIGVGKVLQYVYQGAYYRISGPNGQGDFFNCVGPTTAAVNSVINLQSIPVNTWVFYVYDPSFKFGYILSAFGEVRSGNKDESRPGLVFRATDNDKVYSPETNDISSFIMAGDNVPQDIPAAAWAQVTPFGGLAALDKHFAVMQVRDGVGLTALDDGNVMLSAETLNFRSFIREYQEFKNKSGTDSVEEVFLNLSSSLGYLNPEEFAAVVDQEATDSRAAEVVEPTRSKLPFAVSTQGESIEGLSRVVRGYDSEDISQGKPLFKESVSRDGSYLLQSATGIAIEKYCFITDPFQRKAEALAEDEETKPYEFVHKAEAKYVGIHSLGLEYLAYLRETKLIQKTQKYWDINTSSSLKSILGISSSLFNKPNYRQLPDAFSVLIDPVKKISRKIYASKAGIYLNDDGSIVIEDGWGSSIVMGRGNITISPAKDLILKPGQDLVSLVAGEANITADKGISVSSENGGVSVNANTFMNLRTSGPSSGMLLECLGGAAKADIKGKPVGIVIRADNGTISTVANSLETTSATATLKASQMSIAGQTLRLFGESDVAIFGQSIDSPVSTTTPALHLNGSGLNITGTLVLVGSAFVSENVIIKESLQTLGSVVGAGGGSFLGGAGELPQRAADSLTNSIGKIFTQYSQSFKLTSERAETARIAETTRNTRLYLNDGNNQNLVYRAASARKTPYEFAQVTWQIYQPGAAVGSPEVFGGAQALLETGVFWYVEPSRMGSDGVCAENTEQVKETELKKGTILENYTINLDSTEYKTDPYDTI